MKILAIVDIHDHISMIKKLKQFLGKELESIGLVLVLGDFTTLGSARETKEILKELDFAPVLGLPGNVDTISILNYLEENGNSLHAKKKSINGFEFIGFGGAVGTVGVILFEEKEILETLKKLFKNTNSEKTILLTHCPPKNTKIDFTYKGKHVGSIAVKKIIKEFQPALHLCGHIHEAFGEIQLGKTKSINIGPLEYGHALLLDLGNKIKTKKIRFE